MTQTERARIDGIRRATRSEYRMLARYLSKRYRDIDSGELLIRSGVMDLYQKEIAALFGTATRWGRLQHEINRRHRDILKDLQRDFPYLTRTQIQVYSYLAAGLPFFLIIKLSGLSCENSVYVMKTKMIETISTTACKRREEYLMMLEK